jgi:class 3 adenylate cyclase
VSGLEVHTAARIMAAASDGEILISAAVRDAVLVTQFAMADRGTHELKGVPGTWQLYALEQATPSSNRGTMPAAVH